MRRLFAIGWPYLLVVLHSAVFSAIAMSQVGLPEALNEAAARPSPRVAITFDDLPWNGPGYSDAEIEGLTDTLLATLASRGVPATGLVTCRGIRDGAPFLRKWLDAGMELGNHSTSHQDLNRTPVDEWLADVARCDAAVSEIVGAPLRWFRYPMLHQGDDRTVRDSVARTLESWGYSNAHVTIDNSEWLLARAYDLAMQAGDEADHVLLLHANAIAARHVGDLIDGLGADGFTIASLEEVLLDPIYARVDEYVGPVGLSWIYRAAPLTPDDPWDDIAEAALNDRFRWR